MWKLGDHGTGEEGHQAFVLPYTFPVPCEPHTSPPLKGMLPLPSLHQGPETRHEPHEAAQSKGSTRRARIRDWPCSNYPASVSPFHATVQTYPVVRVSNPAQPSSQLAGHLQVSVSDQLHPPAGDEAFRASCPPSTLSWGSPPSTPRSGPEPGGKGPWLAPALASGSCTRAGTSSLLSKDVSWAVAWLSENIS